MVSVGPRLKRLMLLVKEPWSEGAGDGGGSRSEASSAGGGGGSGAFASTNSAAASAHRQKPALKHMRNPYSSCIWVADCRQCPHHR